MKNVNFSATKLYADEKQKITHSRIFILGFTIVELLAVIVIIGILSAVVVPKILSSINKASLNADKAVLASINRAIETLKIENRLPDSAFMLKEKLDEFSLKNVVLKSKNACIFYDKTQKRAFLKLIADDKLINIDGESAPPINFSSDDYESYDFMREPEEIFDGGFVIAGEKKLVREIERCRRGDFVLPDVKFDTNHAKIDEKLENFVRYVAFFRDGKLHFSDEKLSILLLFYGFFETPLTDHCDETIVERIFIPDLGDKTKEFFEKIDLPVSEVISDSHDVVEEAKVDEKGYEIVKEKEKIGYKLTVKQGKGYTSVKDEFTFCAGKIIPFHKIAQAEKHYLLSDCKMFFGENEISVDFSEDEKGFVMPEKDVSVEFATEVMKYKLTIIPKFFENKEENFSGKDKIEMFLPYNEPFSLDNVDFEPSDFAEFCRFERLGAEIPSEFVMLGEDVEIFAVFNYKSFELTLIPSLYSHKTEKHSPVGIPADFFCNGKLFDLKTEIYCKNTFTLTFNLNGEKYKFLYWIADENIYSDEISCEMPVKNYEITAVFEKLYEIKTNPSQFGSLSADKYSVNYKDAFTLTATPDEDHKFRRFTVNNQTNSLLDESPCTISMSALDLPETADVLEITALFADKFEAPESGNYVELYVNGKKAELQEFLSDNQPIHFSEITVDETDGFKTFYLEKYENGSSVGYYGATNQFTAFTEDKFIYCMLFVVGRYKIVFNPTGNNGNGLYRCFYVQHSVDGKEWSNKISFPQNTIYCLCYKKWEEISSGKISIDVAGLEKEYSIIDKTGVVKIDVADVSTPFGITIYKPRVTNKNQRKKAANKIEISYIDKKCGVINSSAFLEELTY